MKCQDCKYRDGAECRRYPPTHHGYPQVRDDCWCGEWKAPEPERKATARGHKMESKPVFTFVPEDQA